MIKIIRNTVNMGKHNIHLNKTTYAGVVLSLLPIMSPYLGIGPLYMTMLILIGSVGLFWVTTKELKINIPIPVWILWFSHFIISIVAIFTTKFNIALINSMVVGTINVVCLSIMWTKCKYHIFVKSANIVGCVCCIFLVVQAMCLILGMEPPNGKIPGLSLIDHAGWVESTWGFRLNSVFQEPSYFAIFILPILVVALEEKKYKLAILYIFSLFMSSSSLGIIGAICVVVYFFIIKERKMGTFFLLLVCLIVIHSIAYANVDYYRSSFQQSLNKIQNIGIDSQSRLTGHINLFFQLPDINKLFGVGMGQLQNYFATQGVFVSNYSNAFVITLINTGIVGSIIFIVFQLYYFINSKNKLFILIFIGICAIDAFMYSSFFYYILTFVILNKRNEKQILIKNKRIQ